MSPLRRLDSWWFGPEPALNLGISRFLYCGIALLVLASQDLSLWAEVAPEFQLRRGFYALWDIPIAPREVLSALQWAWKGALLLACAGLATRASVGVAAGLSLYLLSLPHNFGKVGHGDAVAVLVLFLLAASRCGDAFSVDRWLRARRGEAPPAPSGHYRWPLRAVWLLTSCILASAGWAKLQRSGLAWIFSDNLAALLVQHRYYHGGQGWTRLGLQLAQHPWLTQGLAALTVLLETGFFLSLFDGRLRALLVPAALLMLVGFAALLGPVFVLLMATLVFFVDWDWMARWLGIAGSRAPPGVDGNRGTGSTLD